MTDNDHLGYIGCLLCAIALPLGGGREIEITLVGPDLPEVVTT